MLSAPPRVRAQLSEALSLISSHDFPARWPSLLPHLVEKLGSDDPQLVNGVLSTADSIYQRYRWAGTAPRRPWLLYPAPRNRCCSAGAA